MISSTAENRTEVISKFFIVHINLRNLKTSPSIDFIWTNYILIPPVSAWRLWEMSICDKTNHKKSSKWESEEQKTEKCGSKALSSKKNNTKNDFYFVLFRACLCHRNKQSQAESEVEWWVHVGVVIINFSETGFEIVLRRGIKGKSSVVSNFSDKELLKYSK